MANLLDLFKGFVKSAGIKENAAIDTFLTENGDALKGMELDSVASNILNENLIGMADARNNPKLKTHFNTQYADKAQSEMLALLESLGISEEDRTKIVESKDGFIARLAAAKPYLEKAITDAKKGSGKDANEEMKRLLKEAEDKHLKSFAEKENEVLSLRSEIENGRLDRFYNQKFSPLTLAGIPEADKADYLKMKVGKWLNDANGKLVWDEELKDYKAVNAKSPDLDFTVDSKTHSFDEFLSLSLQRENLLGKPGGSGNGDQNPHIPKPPGGGASKSLADQIAETNRQFEMKPVQ